MGAFEKIKEKIYDILTYIVPGFLMVVIFSFIIRVDSDFIFADNYLIIILFSYLIGHLIKFLAYLYYKFVDEFNLKITFHPDEIKKKYNLNKNLRTKIFKKNSEYELLKDLDIPIKSILRFESRRKDEFSLIQKYIAKYNMYKSLAFIFFSFYIFLIIQFILKYHSNILELCFIYVFLVIILKTICIIINKEFNFNNLIILISISCTILLFYIDIVNGSSIIIKNLIELKFIFVSLIFYYVFDYEFRRHYLLCKKETLLFYHFFCIKKWNLYCQNK